MAFRVPAGSRSPPATRSGPNWSRWRGRKLIPLREALAGLTRATAQVQKVGTNLNQAVAALNATGQPPGNLIQYARYAAAVVESMDQVVLRIRRHLP